MNFLMKALLWSVTICSCIDVKIPQNVDLDEVIKNSKKYWVDQFDFWEQQGGFTEKNILGAKDIFWKLDFIEGTKYLTNMALFTIINDKIYIEHPPIVGLDSTQENGPELSQKRDAQNPKVLDKQKIVDLATQKLQEIIDQGNTQDNLQNYKDAIALLETIDVLELEISEKEKIAPYKHDPKYMDLYNYLTIGTNIKNDNPETKYYMNSKYVMGINKLVRHIQQCILTKKFPKHLQFWFRVNKDEFDDHYINQNKIDEKWPSFHWDNHKDQKVITIPDEYSFYNFIPKILGCKLKMDNAGKVPWGQKKEIAYWKGERNGILRDHADRVAGRLKLKLISVLNPDVLNADFSRTLESEGYETQQGQIDFQEESYCVVLHDYKYLIDIDGNAGSWGRVPAMLLSDSVPIIIESNFTVMYKNSFVPYYHYMPVKNDQSDLLETIQWLKENDEIAQQIAQNGKALFFRLYNLPNIIEDNTLAFQKYASLQNYIPVAPEERFAWNFKKYSKASDYMIWSPTPDADLVSVEDFFYHVEQPEETDEEFGDDEEDDEEEEDNDNKDEL